MHYSPLKNPRINIYLMPKNPKSYGQDLYAVLRTLDNSNYDAIYIEAPPSEISWMAIQDRVFKAAYK
jgi:L-threonylcarbamoyladenylate synthase